MRVPTISPFCLTGLCCALAMAGSISSCKSMMSGMQTTQTHGGVKYTIQPDERFHRIEKGKNGSLMYDSPELTVVSENGHLQINGQNAGPIKKGDHVQITDSFQVMVNGQPRGNNMTGYHENQQRIHQSKPQTAKRNTISERVVQVSAESPEYLNEEGGRIGVDGIPPGETATLKIIREKLPNGKQIERSESIPKQFEE